MDLRDLIEETNIYFEYDGQRLGDFDEIEGIDGTVFVR